MKKPANPPDDKKPASKPSGKKQPEPIAKAKSTPLVMDDMIDLAAPSDSKNDGFEEF